MEVRRFRYCARKWWVKKGPCFEGASTLVDADDVNECRRRQLMPTMIPLSAQMPRQTGGAQRISSSVSHSASAAQISPKLAPCSAASRSRRFVGRHGAKVILRSCRHNSHGTACSAHCGSEARLVAHRLPHRRRVPLQLQSPQRGMEFRTEVRPGRWVDGAKTARGLSASAESNTSARVHSSRASSARMGCSA